jgi:hypothetical protein
MAEMVLSGPASGALAAGHRKGHGARAHSHGGQLFHRVLAATGARASRALAPPSQVAHAQAPPSGARSDKGAVSIPAQSDEALAQAMALEGAPGSWQSGLRFIMAQESGGQVDAKSPIHSARGLYQLTAANYHFNPHGAASFGNAVEEAQGGIRYIRQRYGTADNAAAFWQSHHWY